MATASTSEGMLRRTTSFDLEAPGRRCAHALVVPSRLGTVGGLSSLATGRLLDAGGGFLASRPPIGGFAEGAGVAFRPSGFPPGLESSSTYSQRSVGLAEAALPRLPEEQSRQQPLYRWELRVSAANPGDDGRPAIVVAESRCTVVVSP